MMNSFQELDIVVDSGDYLPGALSILAAIRPQWKAGEICITVSQSNRMELFSLITYKFVSRFLFFFILLMFIYLVTYFYNLNKNT